MTASRASPPARMTSKVLAQALTPPLLRLALEMAMNLGRDWALTMRIAGNAAAPRMAARRLKVALMCGPYLQRERHYVTGGVRRAIRACADVRRRGQTWADAAAF